MDEQRPSPDESFDDDVHVTGWWQRHDQLSAGRLKAARSLDWAFEGIHGHMHNADPESTASLLWRLLDAPNADPEAVAKGPLQVLLEHRGPEVEHDVADLCTRLPKWRLALAAVALTGEQREAVPALAGYLRHDAGR